MSFIQGMSLADRLVDGPLPPREAAELTTKIAVAVAYAHQRGVIHRDLKPGNIMIDLQGEPKITDFGLAKKLEGGDGLTSTGSILGTPGYMPPEQASGDLNEVAETADVYSLGGILYALLIGRPPFSAASPFDTLMQVIEQEPVAPRALNRTLDVDLETICLKCLQKKPQERYASANALAEELGRYLRNEPIHARPITPLARGVRWCSRNPTDRQSQAAEESAQTAKEYAVESRQRLMRHFNDQAMRLLDQNDAGAALAWLAAAYRLTEPESIGERVARIRFRMATQMCPSLQAIWFHEFFQGYVNDVAFSHRGELVAAAWGSLNGAGFAQAWHTRDGTPAIRRIDHENLVRSVEFSPDDQLLLIVRGVLSRNHAELWQLDDGQQKGPSMLHQQRILQAFFSPDGSNVLTTTNRDGVARLWDVKTGKLKTDRLSLHPRRTCSDHCGLDLGIR